MQWRKNTHPKWVWVLTQLLKESVEMQKKIVSLFIIIMMMLSFNSCKNNDNDMLEEKKECWAGTYVMLNEETEEFKILTVEAETETEDDVVLSFESVRDDDDFKALLKTKSKKYAVCNAGDRCLKFNLKSNATVITVDDIWTNPDVLRNENWSGKYVLLEEGMEIEDFGDSSWNGRYTCKDNGLTVETYAIKEGLVLLTYKDMTSGEKLNFKCYVSAKSKREALYEDEEGRSIHLKLVRSNKTIVITDTLSDETIPPISGRYAI